MNRYHLSANGKHIDQARSRAGAFMKAIYQAKVRGTRVHVLIAASIAAGSTAGKFDRMRILRGW